MIKEDYVSFETAKLLKSKGYNCGSKFWYDDKGIVSQKYIDQTDKPLGLDSHFPCITQQMATKWLREVYNIHNEIRYFPLSNIYRYVIIYSSASFKNIDSHPLYFNTYEEACEAGIKYCLENLI